MLLFFCTTTHQQVLNSNRIVGDSSPHIELLRLDVYGSSFFFFWLLGGICLLPFWLSVEKPFIFKYTDTHWLHYTSSRSKRNLKAYLNHNLATLPNEETGSLFVKKWHRIIELYI